MSVASHDSQLDLPPLLLSLLFFHSLIVFVSINETLLFDLKSIPKRRFKKGVEGKVFEVDLFLC